VKEVKEWR